MLAYMLGKYLSQGQKQRLVIARLLSSNKSLWLLDEPSSSLDRDASIFLKEIIQTLFELIFFSFQKLFKVEASRLLKKQQQCRRGTAPLT